MVTSGHSKDAAQATPWSLIWTRSLEDWSSDLTGPLAGLNDCAVTHIPCLSIERLNEPREIDPFDYAVFTSANAADVALSWPRLATLIKAARGVYTHGAATAATLEAKGVATTVVQVKTAKELAAWLKRELAPGSKICFPAATTPTFAMADDLTAHGLPCKHIHVYKTIPVATDALGQAFTPEHAAALIGSLSGVIAFASPSAVEGFAAVFHPSANRLGKELAACVIGPTTAVAARRHFESVSTASGNTLAALIDVVRSRSQP